MLKFSDSVLGPPLPSLFPLAISSSPRAPGTICVSILLASAPVHDSFLSSGHVHSTAYSTAPQVHLPQTELIILPHPNCLLLSCSQSQGIMLLYPPTQARNLEVTLDSLLFKFPIPHYQGLGHRCPNSPGIWPLLCISIPTTLVEVRPGHLYLQLLPSWPSCIHSSLQPLFLLHFQT